MTSEQRWKMCDSKPHSVRTVCSLTDLSVYKVSPYNLINTKNTHTHVYYTGVKYKYY